MLRTKCIENIGLMLCETLNHILSANIKILDEYHTNTFEQNELPVKLRRVKTWLLQMVEIMNRHFR